jgi:hypothetical protein
MSVTMSKKVRWTESSQVERDHYENRDIGGRRRMDGRACEVIRTGLIWLRIVVSMELL